MRRLTFLIFAVVVLTIGSRGAYAQDPAAGEKVFAQCRACHQIGENAKNAIGPELNGVIGRKAGTVEGYSYSAANKNSGIVWTEETFAEYIQNPRAKIPGTKMVFAGIKNPKQIQDLIAFLKQFDASGKKTSAADKASNFAARQTKQDTSLNAAYSLASGPGTR